MRNSNTELIVFKNSPNLLGSGVFFINPYEKYSESLQIESDNPGDILGSNIYLVPNGHSFIQDLLRHPLTEKSEILKRQKILKQMSEIDNETFEKMNHQSQIIGYLFSAFTSDELDYRNFINFAQELSDLINKKKPSDPHGAWSLGLDFDTIYNTGKLIPEHIQDIHSIGGEFYLTIAKELEEASHGLRQFPIREVFSLTRKIMRINTISEGMRYSKHFRERHQEKLKKISEQYVGKLHDIYRNYKNDIANFTRIYRVIDAMIILSSHIRVGHFTATQISKNGEEKGNNIRDARILLGTRMTRREKDIDDDNDDTSQEDDFEQYISNNLPNNTYPLEFYSGGNGSGKSSWLKTRLSLQLFHQTFGYGAGENISLPVKNKIVFMNRGGSGYAENLSAFGSDVEKLKVALMGNIGNTLFIFDEFGSTIPEGEAYALSRGLIEYLRENGAKIIFSTHNEHLITAIEGGEIPGSFMGHFPTEFTRDTIRYSRKLTPGADIAHTLSVFHNIGFDNSILSQARIMMAPDIKLRALTPQKLTPISIQNYTPEERESLKNMTGIGFAGLSRGIDILPSQDPDAHTKWYLKSPLPKKRERDFAPDYTISRYASSDDGSLTKEEYIPPSFDLNGSLKSVGVDFPHELYPILTPKNTTNKFDYCSDALRGVLSFGMTSDPKELLERQQFFSELQNLKADDIDELSNEIYKHSYLVNAFHRPRRTSNYGHNSNGLRCDFGELKEFNKVLWNTVLSCEDFWGGRDRAIINTIIQLFDIEKILGNTASDQNAELITRLKRYRNLLERLERAKKRGWKTGYTGFTGIAELASQVSDRIHTLFQEEFGGDKEGIKALLGELKGIVSSFPPHDILKISKKKKDQIGKITKDIEFFRLPKEHANDYKGRSILEERDTTLDLIEIINALQGTGTLIDPLLTKLRSLDSIHAHQIASYIESMIRLPTTEEFTDRIKRRVRDPLFLTELGGWNNPRYEKEAKYILPRMHEDRHFHPVQIINELCGLVRTANRINELGWKRVKWNTTGEIQINGLSHPGKRELPRETQVQGNFSLASTQHFDILEGATMGGKTMHIQSVMWTIRLAHSLGYVPAESAEMPIFDGIIYLDRILEDESRQMSAGQKDAHYWKELINRVMVKIGTLGAGGRYWWSIDEMISSVPSRYQKGLVIAILENLKSLGQRGQISIHNPDFVSKILAIDPESYMVHHPEIIISADGNVESTHKIIPGRSRDRDGNFSAFSLETAEMMGLDSEIIKRAKNYRFEIQNEKL